jgi:chromosome segregation ATPase
MSSLKCSVKSDYPPKYQKENKMDAKNITLGKRVLIPAMVTGYNTKLFVEHERVRATVFTTREKEQGDYKDVLLSSDVLLTPEDVHSEELAGLRERCDSLQKENEKLKRECQEIRVRYSEAQEKIAALKKEIQEMKARNETLGGAVKDAKAIIGELFATLQVVAIDTATKAVNIAERIRGLNSLVSEAGTEGTEPEGAEPEDTEGEPTYVKVSEEDLPDF